LTSALPDQRDEDNYLNRFASMIKSRSRHSSKYLFRLAVLVVVLLVFNGCSTQVKLNKRHQYLVLSSCYISGETYNWNTYPKPFSAGKIDYLKKYTRFNDNSLYLAYSLNIDTLLRALCETEKQYNLTPTPALRDRYDHEKQKISEKVNLAFFDMNSLKAELDCEEERARQVGMYLQNKVGKREKIYAVAGIVSGAVLGIAASTAGLSSGDSKLPDILGLAGGIGGAALGFKALAVDKKVEFLHPRNQLRDIWEGRDTAQFFPPAIWFYLNNPRNPQKNSTSLRLQLIAKWMAFDQLSDANSKERQEQIDLYFGTGGEYNADELNMRARMLQQLESTIMLITQDLKTLLSETYKSDI
jgi:hypothetical protein